MKLSVKRLSQSKDFGGSTIGALYIDDVFECWTLEDEYRAVKVMKETRIPDGTYEISLANWGSMNDVYKQRYPSYHKGMLLLKDVPGFEGILIHRGVTEADTEGCILVGCGVNSNKIERGTLVNTPLAYENMYKKVIAKLNANEKVMIEVTNLEKLDA